MDRDITAIASLLWPVLVLAALLVYRRPLGRLLRSAERREWTIEIAGQKLSMGQIREQQSALISDLQRQLGTMRQELGTMREQLDAVYSTRYLLPSDLLPSDLLPSDLLPSDLLPSDLLPSYLQPSEPAAEPERVDEELADRDEPAGPALERAEYPPDPWGAPSGPPQAPGSAPPSEYRPAPRPQPSSPPAHPSGYEPSGTGVLWVDDHPENNAILADSLVRDGVRIDTALSTDEALARLRRHRYAAVISDMGRAENGADVPDAGLRLLDAVRRTDPVLPFVIYCSERAALTYHDRALAAGANDITASPAEVVTQLQRLHLV